MYALGTFSASGSARWPGIVRDQNVIPLGALMPDAPDDWLSVLQEWPRWEPRIYAAVASSGAAGWRPWHEVTAHLPYKPENLYGAGANYRRHVIELIVDKGAGGLAHLAPEARRQHAVEIMDRRAATGKPFVFVAPRSAIAGPDETLVVPHDHVEPDWELELAVLMGKPARRVSREQALEYVAGYTIANDVTARELVERPDIPQMGMDWLACKGAPGFKILGPYITPARFVSDPQKLHIRLSLNGRVMQDGGTDDMIFPIARLIEFVSAYVQLLPGDLIMTGSPAGNGTHYNRFLRDGDLMCGEIDGLVGAQVVRCAAEQPVASHGSKGREAS
jgi:2-keto-4-pentenoate hydratase/2-oxohepta-3-ene-1,7-dioic acid hydratase in catechol pathway